ncbi:RNA polymerase sigma factor, sigma-70 family [Algoriphagus winogradskyi]|uniref:RNA polymerase sigma factor, sigma-70 family n=2 Tax=Algoriphagus winogradskyi TaxID=237017 RepID=A0ABY1NMY3_9BACT|nr:RNA polymerase sigma factor, sigma-70 family [Algoriphagus winogradskyi]
MPKDIFNSYSQEELTKAIINNDNVVLQSIYKLGFPKVQHFILRNSGSEDQAKDIFQDAFISFWTNIRSGKFAPENESALVGYLFQIAKNKWLDHLRSSKTKKTVPLEERDITDFPNLEVHDKEAYYLKIEYAFQKIGKDCHELLTRFYFKKESLTQVSRAMGWTAQTAKNNKYRCMQKLKNIIQEGEKES